MVEIVSVNSNKSFSAQLNNYLNKSPSLMLFATIVLLIAILVFTILILKFNNNTNNKVMGKFSDHIKILRSDLLDKYGFTQSGNYFIKKIELPEDVQLKLPNCIGNYNINTRIKQLLFGKSNDDYKLSTSDPSLNQCKNEYFSDYNDFIGDDENENKNEDFIPSPSKECIIQVKNENFSSFSNYYFKKCPNKRITNKIHKIIYKNDENYPVVKGKKVDYSFYGQFQDDPKIFKLCGRNPTDIIDVKNLKYSVYNDETFKMTTKSNKYNVVPDQDLDHLNLFLSDNKQFNKKKFYFYDKSNEICNIPDNLKMTSQEFGFQKNKNILIDIKLNINENNIYELIAIHEEN